MFSLFLDIFLIFYLPRNQWWKWLFVNQSHYLENQSSGQLRSNLYIVLPFNRFLFFWAVEKQRELKSTTTNKNQALPTHWRQTEGAGCLTGVQQWYTTVARKQTWNWDWLSANGCLTHRWCRLCWCCALWLAPGRCPADRDAPGRCQPCWRPAAGAGWKSPGVSSPLSSAWWELQWQTNVVSRVKTVKITLLPTPPVSTNELQHLKQKNKCHFCVNDEQHLYYVLGRKSKDKYGS